MAAALKVDSLRYLNVADLGPCIDVDGETLCTGCVMGKYPTKWGNQLMRRARRQAGTNAKAGRTYE